MIVTKNSKRWPFFLVASLVTCFVVFVLPFFFPASQTAALSVSNAAGFNNKIAAVGAALCACVMFFVFLRDTSADNLESQHERPVGRIPFLFWTFLALAVSSGVLFVGWLILISGLRYSGDVGYFVNQLTSYGTYHRQLYSQIEFPYGPLLFYPPILLHSLLSKWHVSMEACYLVILALHQFAGILLLGYVANGLGISRSWKFFAACCFAIFTIEPMFGLNYTLLRFLAPGATLLFCVKRQDPKRAAVLFMFGEILNLGVSPEMGFAFGAGAVAYGLLQTRLNKLWILASVAPVLGCGFFLLLAGKPYLRMLRSFAHGTYNFIVEPLPHILIVLLAVVWLIPMLLATRIKEKKEDAVVLISFFILSMALLPVAFGRADPAHVFFNGIGLILLSLVAMAGRPQWKQLSWGAFIAGSMLIGYGRIIHVWSGPLHEVARTDVALYPNSPLSHAYLRLAKDPGLIQAHPMYRGDGIDTSYLRSLVGSDPVATPLEVNVTVENQLKEGGWYRPSFFFYMVAVLDDATEDRKIDELNEAGWALLPGVGEYRYSENQSTADQMMGIALPYRARKAPHAVGVKFTQNIASNWTPVARLNEYTLYRRKF